MSEKPQRIVLGTRGSALALAQAEMTEAALRAAHPDLVIERRIIKTTGDRRTDVPLTEVAKAEGHLDKGVFIKELELALEAGEIDVAVHSLKDLPSELEEQFALTAVLPRAAVADVVVLKGMDPTNPEGMDELLRSKRLATSSVRRQRQLEHLLSAVTVVDIRGNVPTRIRKLAKSPNLDGVVLAAAGLQRLGYRERFEVEGVALTVLTLEESWFYPAAGQGAVALESRAADSANNALLKAVNDPTTMGRVVAEREFLRLLGAGCDTPVGVFTWLDGEAMGMRARVYQQDQELPLESEVEGPRSDPASLADRLVKGLRRRES